MGYKPANRVVIKGRHIERGLLGPHYSGPWLFTTLRTDWGLLFPKKKQMFMGLLFCVYHTKEGLNGKWRDCSRETESL